MTRDELMNATSPSELFGDALGQPQALRRAYASLIRQYRPEDDPEAFTHVRELYERALRGPSTPPEAHPSEPPTAPVPQPPIDPLARIEALLPSPPWDLSIAQLEQALHDIDSVPVDVPVDPDRMARLEDRLLDGLAGHRVRADPDVPDALLAVAGHQGSRRELLDAFRRLGEEVPYDRLHPAIERTALHHPAIWALYALAHRRLTHEGPTREGWMVGERRSDRDGPFLPSDVSMANVPPAVPWLLACLFGALGPIYVRGATSPAGSIIAVGMLTLVAWHAAVAVQRALYPSIRYWQEPTRATARALLADGRWPHELLDASLGAIDDVPPAQRVWSEGRSLLGLDTDLALLPGALTDAHTRRLDDECTP
jgi:hypothetical protein